MRSTSRPRAPRVSRRWLLVAFALVAALRVPVASGRGTKDAPGPPPEWTEEDGRVVVKVAVPRPLKAYVITPTEAPAEGTKAELLVSLHGHGGTATGLLQYGAGIMGPRNGYVLACEGSGTIPTDRGEGHTWSAADTAGILACVDATIAKYPVDPKRVVLLGHSAGGTMSLETYRARPSAFAGVVTSAAPMTPGAGQKGARVAVMLGTKDGNFAGAPAAIAAAEKTIVGRVLLITDLPHELPRVAYAQECVAWVLDSKSGSDVLHVPLEEGGDVRPPPDSPAAKAKGKGYRHVLVPYAGARGAPADALPPKEAKAKAAELAARWKKAPAGTDLGDDVAAASSDPLSKDTRGVVSGLVLARYGGGLALALGKLKGGDVTGPVESDAGWHVVARDRAD
ncbi:MAG: peptidylprolyl isomerase [Planctomycetia bacterium]|nr:peptidylprolyl isomerase [Planctomycetia bacterium]